MEGLRDTQEQRFSRRRARIDALKKKKNSKSKGAGGQSTTSDVNELRYSKNQIKKSRVIVDDAAEKAVENVSNVAVGADEREMERRAKEQDMIVMTKAKVERELLKADRMSEKIEDWASLLELDTPERLHEAIQHKRDECVSLDRTKLTLVRELESMLVQRDEEYTKQLQQNVEDVGDTLTTMKAEFHMLSFAYESELKTIETAFVEERLKMLHSNQEELDKLFQIRTRMENSILREAQGKEDEFYDELQSLRLRSKEEFNNLKITLENNIQDLQQQLEEMRSTYQLNTQKLEYNLSILKERDVENRQTVEQFRKKIQRLTESLSKYTLKYKKENAKFKKENSKLTEDYRRITVKFKDLQKKYRHFELLDHKKYDEVFAMNKKEVIQLADKVMQADRIIHDQILGKEWKVPGMYQKILDLERNTKKQASKEEASNGTGEGGQSANEGKTEGMYSNDHIRKVMAMLSDECRFLVDSNTLESCKGVSLAEAQLLRADAILSSLGVEDRGDLDRLCNLFFNSPKVYEMKVKGDDVINIVRSFIFDNKRGHKGKPRAKGDKSKKRDNEFWEDLEKLLPETTQRTWAALENGLFKYNRLLKERQSDIQETNELLKTNEELKVLLQEYLNSEANEDLQLPPTHHIRQLTE